MSPLQKPIIWASGFAGGFQKARIDGLEQELENLKAELNCVHEELQRLKEENEKLIENNFSLFMKEDTATMKYNQIKHVLKKCIPIIKNWGVWDEKKQDLLKQIKTVIGKEEG